MNVTELYQILYKMEDFKSTPAIRNTNLVQLVTPIVNQTQV
jgi:hypothetical protein